MASVGVTERFALWRRRPSRRPKGGTASRDAYVPATPTPATGQPPASLAEAFETAGVAPPRPLVWVGTAASGSAVWSSPVANGAGVGLWRDLREASEATRSWPVLTGSAPLPASWHLDRAQRPGDVRHLPDASALLDAAAQRQDAAEPGFRTRLEPSATATIEADLAAGYLALVTDAVGWELPLAVGWDGVGGWAAVEHAAVLRRLSDLYGAQVVALTADSLGLVVARPPRTHEDAYAVAEQLYAYCPDVVTHGVRSLWALATTMAVSGAWSLRWSTPTTPLSR